MAPEGLTFVSSWVTEDLSRCFQRMECHDRSVLDRWTAHGSDLVDFEALPVLTSVQAVEKISPRL